MLNTRYANAYKEVLIVINNLNREDYDKIPNEYIKFLESNCNNEYKFEYDFSKNFNEQNFLDDTKYILFGLFEKFGATDVQKQKIKDFKTTYNKKLEQEKRERYNPDNLFNNRENKLQSCENTVLSETAMIEYKNKNFIQKCFDKIKNILLKK